MATISEANQLLHDSIFDLRIEDIKKLLLKMIDDNSHGEINIVIVDGEVKFINETYKNKY